MQWIILISGAPLDFEALATSYRSFGEVQLQGSPPRLTVQGGPLRGTVTFNQDARVGVGFGDEQLALIRQIIPEPSFSMLQFRFPEDADLAIGRLTASGPVLVDNDKGLLLSLDEVKHRLAQKQGWLGKPPAVVPDEVTAEREVEATSEAETAPAPQAQTEVAVEAEPEVETEAPPEVEVQVAASSQADVEDDTAADDDTSIVDAKSDTNTDSDNVSVVADPDDEDEDSEPPFTIIPPSSPPPRRPLTPPAPATPKAGQGTTLPDLPTAPPPPPAAPVETPPAPAPAPAPAVVEPEPEPPAPASAPAVVVPEPEPPAAEPAPVMVVPEPEPPAPASAPAVVEPEPEPPAAAPAPAVVEPEPEPPAPAPAPVTPEPEPPAPAAPLDELHIFLKQATWPALLETVSKLLATPGKDESDEFIERHCWAVFGLELTAIRVPELQDDHGIPFSTFTTGIALDHRSRSHCPQEDPYRHAFANLLLLRLRSELDPEAMLVKDLREIIEVE